jgi:thiol-disulfide isomerase/thioredoxin
MMVALVAAFSFSAAVAASIGDLTQAQLAAFHHVKITSQRGERFAWAGSSKSLVLIVNWGSWCAGCVAEIPRLQQLEREFGPRLRVILLSMPEHWAEDRAYAHAHNLTLPLYVAEFADPEERRAVRFSRQGPNGAVVTSFPALSLWTADGRYLGGVIGSVEGLMPMIAQSETGPRVADGG